jgi:hypothetical protein
LPESAGELVAAIGRDRPLAVELLDLIVADADRLALIAPLVTDAFGSVVTADVGRLAAAARGVGACEKISPGAAILLDRSSCAGWDELASARGELATAIAAIDPLPADELAFDLRTILVAYVEELGGRPLAPDGDLAAAWLAACNAQAARCQAVLGPAGAWIATSSPAIHQLVEEEHLAPAIAAGLLGAGATPAEIGHLARAPSDARSTEIIAALEEDQAVRDAIAPRGQLDPAALARLIGRFHDAPRVPALVDDLFHGRAAGRLAELASDLELASRKSLAGESRRLPVALLEALPAAIGPGANKTVRVDVSAVEHAVADRRTAERDTGFVARATIGAGVITSGDVTAARPYEELGVGYRGPAVRDLLLGAHAVASGLLFQADLHAFARHPLFVGLGADLSWRHLVELSLSLGPIVDLAGSQPGAGVVMLSVQLPLVDYVRAAIGR